MTATPFPLFPAKSSSGTPRRSSPGSRPTGSAWPTSPRSTACSTCGWARSAPRGPSSRSPTTPTAASGRSSGGTTTRRILYVQDAGGDENWRLYDIDLDTGDDRDLTPFEEVQAQLSPTRRQFPTELLVGLNRDNPQLHDVYHLDLETGELEMVLENPGFVGLVADGEMRVRAALRPGPTAAWTSSAGARAPAADQWEVFLGSAPTTPSAPRPSASPPTATGCTCCPRSTPTPAGWCGSTLPPAWPPCWPRTRSTTSSGVMSHPDTKEVQLVSFSRPAWSTSCSTRRSRTTSRASRPSSPAT